jgi:hypothetical protein
LRKIRLFDAVFEGELAIEFFFLFLGQGVHEDDAIGERGLRLSAMRTGITGAGGAVFTEIEFVDLEWSAAIEVDTAFEFHKEQRFNMNLTDYME